MLLTPSARIAVPKGGYIWNMESPPLPYLDEVRHVSGDASEDDDETGIDLRSPVLDQALERSHRVYDPFKDVPGLFLMFSRLPQTAEAILSFANQYGSLTNPTLEYWQEAIRDVRAAVHLWRAVKDGDLANLAEHVVWHGPRLKILSPLRRAFVPSDEYYSDTRFWDSIIQKFRPGQSYRVDDKLAPAQDLLAWVLETRQTVHGVITPVQYLPGRYRFELVINYLLDVIWTQFVMAVCEDQCFRDCQHCARPLRLTPDVTRNDRLYCSTALMPAR